jgi:L-ascorbate metabolism protein UlaG (beta-lactamase superfamily)
MEDIAKVKKGKTIFVAPKDVAAKLIDSVVTVIPGQTYNVGNLKIQTIPAYNLDKKFHPKQNKWVGYIITLSSGQKIYHAGDTDFIPEMKEIITDIAMLPCGGTYTMTATQAADAANNFKPKILIPMHFGEGLGTIYAGDEVKKLYKGVTVIKAQEK